MQKKTVDWRSGLIKLQDLLTQDDNLMKMEITIVTIVDLRF